MTKGLERVTESSLVPGVRRSYELAKTPAEVLELLGRSSGPPILTAEEAGKVGGERSFFILNDEGFSLYKQWSSLITSAEGVALQDVMVGPAVRGRLTPTARGSRLDIAVRPYAATPAQQLRLAIAAAGLATFVIAPVAIAGLHPVALVISAMSLFGPLASVLLYRRRRRAEDIRELLAIVERTFAPLELSAAGESPWRRDDPQG